MKKILSIIFLVGLMSATSCKKSVLDKIPLDIISSADIFHNRTLADSYLASAYLQTYIFDFETPDRIKGAGPHFYVFYITNISDEAVSQQGWDGDVNPFYRGGLNINGGLLEWWETSYRVIRTLNEFIKHMPGSTLDETYKQQRIAEARWLRAFNYFAMVKRYGGVPLITEPQNLDDSHESLFPKRDTEQAVYDFIVAECDAIVNELPPSYPATDYGRPTKYAALALKSRAALYAGSIAQFGEVKLNGLVGIDANKADYYYQESYNASKELITNSPHELYKKETDKVKNFRNLFLDKTDNPEKIFVKPHNTNNVDQGGAGWNYDFGQAPVPNGWGQGNACGVYLEMAEEFERVDGTPGRLDRSKIGTVSTDGTSFRISDPGLWGNRDSRFYASIYTMNTMWKGGYLDNHNGIIKSAADGGGLTYDWHGINGRGPSTMSTGFGVLKYLDENISSADFQLNTGTDFIVFRYGEILLNYAEAAFNLNKPADALDGINQIRERAGIKLLTAATLDREKIRHERKVELAFEGHRYWDARRWRIATDVFSKQQSGLQYIWDHGKNMGGNMPLESYFLKIIPNLDGTVGGAAFYPMNYYLPITLARTGQNDNLVENPDYE